MSWNPAQIARLRDMWAKGQSASDIAEELGVGRGSILAKANRLGLRRRIANESDREKFDRAVDFVADAPLGAPVSIEKAAIRVGLSSAVAARMWAVMAVNYDAMDPRSGNEVVRPL